MKKAKLKPLLFILIVAFKSYNGQNNWLNCQENDTNKKHLFCKSKQFNITQMSLMTHNLNCPLHDKQMQMVFYKMMYMLL